MEVTVAISGRSWRIAIDAAANEAERGRLVVTLKGQRRVVDASWIDPETISLIATNIDAGRQGVSHSARDVGVRSIGPGEVEVSLGGRVFHATVTAAGSAVRRSGGAASLSRGTQGRETIVAPMPGRVVRVLVTPGDRVSAGQGVVIVEAMKMENELRSPKDGLVREVKAIEGSAVEAGAVLAVIE